MSSTSSAATAETPPTTVKTVWFDPGLTTGVAVLELDAAWLYPDAGLAPSFSSLGAAVRSFEHMQVGRYPRYADRLGPVPSARFESGGPVASHTKLEIENVWQCQQILDGCPGAAWGYEDFTIRIVNSNPALLSPARIGLALTTGEMWVEDNRRAPFVQSPSLAKNTCSDARLKQAGLYCPGVEHANDAMRHAVTFLRRARDNASLRMAAWPVLGD